MLEIKYEEKQIVDNLYNEIKNIILSKKDNKTYDYNHKQHHLYEEREYPGISKNYFNESGSVEFENINGQTIKLQINRWHPHKHNGCSGLNGNPCLSAIIYVIKNEEKQILWELSVKSGTLYYKAEVSNIEIPFSILQEKKQSLNDIVSAVDDQEFDIHERKIEPQETRILFDEIENLYDKCKSAEEYKEELLLQREKDIENARKKIIDDYSKKLDLNEKNITSVKKDLNTFEKLLVKYSTFNLDLIGSILQQLISITESEEYLYKQVSHTFKKRVHGVMDSWDEDVQTFANIIITKNKSLDYYDSTNQAKSKIHEFVENGDALLLSEQDINEKKQKQITFYNLTDEHIESRVNFGKFDYVKDFIDNVIQYRFQNNMDKITEKDMLLFLQNYIIQHKDVIVKNYESKFDSKVLKLKPNNC